jgi:hypothetical protein
MMWKRLAGGAITLSLSSDGAANPTNRLSEAVTSCVLRSAASQ